MMSKWDRLRPQPVPDEPEMVTMAIDAMHLATDKTALEHSVADLTIRLRHVEHSRDGYKEALEAAEAEIEKLQTRVQELDKVAFPTMPLPDALQAELLLDLTDQPPADVITPERTQPYPVYPDDYVQITPSTNGTTS